MKIAMVAYAYYFTDARIKGYVKHLAKRGIKVDILALKEPGKNINREKIDNNTTIFYITNKYIGNNFFAYIWSYIKFFIAAFWKLTLLWIKNKYQVIHIHNMPNFIIFTALIPKIFGCKLILDTHDIMSLNFQTKYGNKKILTALIKIEEKFSADFANKVICADHFQKKFLVNARKIDEQKIIVIMNLPDLSIFRHKDTLPPNKPELRIVYHGTITYRLGVDLILKAISAVKDIIPVKFFLYGTGDYIEECLKLINKMGLQNIVYASRKFFSVENLPELLKDKSLGIIGMRNLISSQYGLPVKMMEYMASDIPVIAPALKNILYYFNDKQICFYKPEDVNDLADKIIFLYNHPERRKELSKNAFEYIQQHNWEQEFNKYMKIIYEFS